MIFMIGSGILGLVVGALVGYFLSTYVVIGLSILVGFLTYLFLKSEKGSTGGTSGGLGMIMIGGPLFICFMLSMWITWFLAPGGIGMSFDLKPLIEFLKHLLLR